MQSFGILKLLIINFLFLYVKVNDCLLGRSLAALTFLADSGMFI